MIENLYVNSLIRFDDGSIKRVIWINDNQKYMFVIDVDNSQMPYLIKKTDIDPQNVSILKKDIYIEYTNENMLPDSYKRIRDRAWDSISEIVMTEPDIYYKYTRRKLIIKACEKSGLTIKTIYDYLKKYWKKGKNKNALLPNYYKCGNAGNSKSANGKKLGRPRKNPEVLGKGINVTEDIKRIFEIVRTKYYLNTCDMSIPSIYEKMLQSYFSRQETGEDGKTILVLEKEIPSIVQFRYWMENRNNENIEEFLRKRKSDRRYELEFREILGRSDRGMIGPGSIYQIDATVADVYIVSRYNKEWVIGRPVVYLVADVFSRMIDGVHVGLEGPSWIGAMMALCNTMTDKVKYCSEHEIYIREEEWPSRHVPFAIYADKGELISKKAEQMASLLGIAIENAPPYRADLKGIVERKFRTLQDKVIPLLPGAVLKDFGKRGAHDYRVDGTLDIEEFTKIIILSVLEHNRSWLGSFERTKDMISDDIIPKPINLWHWGIINRSGKLNEYPEDFIRLSLMPVDKGRVTEKGIFFRNMYYSSEKALKEKWYVHARNKGSWDVHISYDPRKMDNVYLIGEDGRNYDICSLLDNQRYGNLTMDEIGYLFAHEKMQKDKEEHKILENSINTNMMIDEIIKNAKRSKENLFIRSNVNEIKSFRKIEKEKLREKEAFTLKGLNSSDTETKKNIIIDKSEVQSSVPVDLLQKLQDEFFERKDIE